MITNTQMQFSKEGDLLVIKINLNTFPAVAEAYDLLLRTTAAPQYLKAAFALLGRAVGACFGDASKELLAAVPAANDESRPL